MEKKLTAEQIAIIDETLVLNALNYEDIKHEVVDHIASEIETIMSFDEINFDVALKIVLDKWETQLKSITHDRTFGSNLTAPKIAKDKMGKIVINDLKLSWLLAMIVNLFIVFIKQLTYSFGQIEGFLDVLRMVITISLFASYGLYFMGKRMLYKSKFKTTFSELYNWSFSFVLILGLNLAYELYKIVRDSTLREQSFSSSFVSLWSIFYILSAIVLLIKHYNLKRKYQLI